MCIPWFWFTCMSSDFISSFQFILPNYKLLGFVSKKEEKMIWYLSIRLPAEFCEFYWRKTHGSKALRREIKKFPHHSRL